MARLAEAVDVQRFGRPRPPHGRPRPGAARVFFWHGSTRKGVPSPRLARPTCGATSSSNCRVRGRSAGRGLSPWSPAGLDCAVRSPSPSADSVRKGRDHQLAFSRHHLVLFSPRSASGRIGGTHPDGMLKSTIVRNRTDEAWSGSHIQFMAVDRNAGSCRWVNADPVPEPEGASL